MSDERTRRPWSLLLTATIDVADTPFVTRRDPASRAADYGRALSFYVQNPQVQHIVFCENSGADLGFLEKLTQRNGKHVEFMSAPRDSMTSSRGKGFGELSILEHVIRHSNAAHLGMRFLKVTGRYSLTNLQTFAQAYGSGPECDVMCDLSAMLTYADSRVFGFTSEFLVQYLLPLRDRINDHEGSYLEHVLADAVLMAIADGRRWRLPPSAAELSYISGTHDRPGKSDFLRTNYRRLKHLLKRIAFAW